MKARIWLLLVLLLVMGGVFWRIWRIESIPAGLAMDEASFGINSWSIANYGMDEYGKHWPTTFRAFADFKLPAYGYLTAMIMKVFGLGVWQIRATSVVSGFLICILAGLITFELSKKRRLALATAILCLWSPWLIFYSRGAFEGNLGLMFFLLGWFGLLKAKNNWFFLILAIVGFSGANYSYISYKLLTIVSLGFWILVTKSLRSHQMTWILVFCFLTINLPAYLSFANASGNNRIFSLMKLNSTDTGYHPLIKLAANYLAYFSPKNLFWNPDPLRHRHYVDLSVTYWFLLPFSLIGLREIVRRPSEKLTKWLVFMALLSPIPAAIAMDPFATLRAIPLAIPVMMVTAIGLERANWKWIGGLAVIACLSLTNSLSIMRNLQTMEWNAGVKETTEWVMKYYPDKKVAWFDGAGDLYPNILIASNIDPKLYWARTPEIDINKSYLSPNFERVNMIERFTVGPFDKQQYFYRNDYVVVGRPEEMPDHEPLSAGMVKRFEVKDLVGKVLFAAFTIIDRQ